LLKRLIGALFSQKFSQLFAELLLAHPDSVRPSTSQVA
jgi:hypothetical protein